MKLAARYAVLIATVVIVTLCSASCAPRTNIALVSTPQPTSTITTTPIVTPTPKLTITPIPTDSPVPTISSDEAVIINQQIQDFLQYKGIYSQENIQSYLFSRGTANEEIFYKLGVVYEGETSYQIQGWLFGYTMRADDLLLIVGFDSKNNDRFVTALKIPLFLKSINRNGGVLLTHQNSWRNPTNFYGSNERPFEYEEVVTLLTLNQPFLYEFITLSLPSDEEAKEKGWERNIELYHEQRDNQQYGYNLVSKLDRNNQAVHVLINAKNYPITEIDEVSDLAELDRLTIPTLDVLVCIDG